MKKTFLLLAALMVMSSSMFAQSLDFSLGAKLGYQSTKLSYHQSDIKDGFLNHFTIGAFGRFEYGHLYVQPELLFFKSSNKLFEADVYNSEIYINTNVQIPILIGVKFNLTDDLALRAQLGPTANYIICNPLFGDDDYYEDDDDYYYRDYGDDYYDDGDDYYDDDYYYEDYETVAWGFQFGLGVDFKRFTLDINYNLGLSPVFNKINNDVEWEAEELEKARQNTFMVTLGFKIL